MQQAFRIDGWRRKGERDLKPLRRLIPLVLAHPLEAVLGSFFLVLSSASLLALTGGAQWVVDHGFGIHAKSALIEAFLTAAAIAAVLAISTGFRMYFLYTLGERVVADLRQVVFAHVLSLDQSQVSTLRTGEILSRMTTDMTLVEGVVGNVAPVAARNLMTLLGAVTWMVLISPSITGLVVLMIPFLLMPMVVLSRRIQALSVRAQDRFAEAIAEASEGLGALDTIQAFGQEAHAARHFNQNVERAFEASRSQIGARGALSGVMIGMVFAGMFIILYQAAVAVMIRHELTPGALIQLLALAFFAANAVKDLSEVWGQVQKASGAAQRVAAILDMQPRIARPAHPRPLPTPPLGSVVFENVVFRYPGRLDQAALNGLSFHVRPGERVALVGPSGGGKSTVLRLLLRFYDPESGVIRVDGVDLREADPAEVRARLALVAQEAPLFSGSAADNIRFGRAGADVEALVAAASAAQADAFVRALPQGYATAVGEHGKTLSGGQRQRITIARALLRDAPILLLDEATSALDSENERLVQQALKKAMAGRTSLVIAHRLATVLEADRILVLDSGRLVEEGRHADLLARDGLYARLARLQFGAEAA